MQFPFDPVNKFYTGTWGSMVAIRNITGCLSIRVGKALQQNIMFQNISRILGISHCFFLKETYVYKIYCANLYQDF